MFCLVISSIIQLSGKYFHGRQHHGLCLSSWLVFVLSARHLSVGKFLSLFQLLSLASYVFLSWSTQSTGPFSCLIFYNGNQFYFKHKCFPSERIINACKEVLTGCHTLWCGLILPLLSFCHDTKTSSLISNVFFHHLRILTWWQDST